MREWALELRARGLRPGLRILRVVPPGADADPWERHFIAKFDSPRLLNVRGTTNPGERLARVWARNGTFIYKAKKGAR
jgi:hypothetical protein